MSRRNPTHSVSRIKGNFLHQETQNQGALPQSSRYKAQTICGLPRSRKWSKLQLVLQSLKFLSLCGKKVEVFYLKMTRLMTEKQNQGGYIPGEHPKITPNGLKIEQNKLSGCGAILVPSLFSD